MPVDEVRKLINAIDDHRTQFNFPPFTPFISKRLRKLVGISEPTKPVNENKLIEVQQQIEKKNNQTNYELQQQIENTNKQTMENLKQMNDEHKQQNNELKQQMKDMQELLNRFINKSNENNVIKDKIDDKNNE